KTVPVGVLVKRGGQGRSFALEGAHSGTGQTEIAARRINKHVAAKLETVRFIGPVVAVGGARRIGVEIRGAPEIVSSVVEDVVFDGATGGNRGAVGRDVGVITPRFGAVKDVVVDEERPVSPRRFKEN